MTTTTVDSSSALVWPSGAGPALIVNMDVVTPVYVGNERSVSTSSIQIPPLGSLAVDGARDWYASTAVVGTSVMVQIAPGGTQWAASPLQIAEQIAFSQAPAPNIFLASTYPHGFNKTAVTQVQFPSVHLRIRPTSGYGVVTLSWYSDPAGANLLGSDAWHVFSAADTGLVNGCALNAYIPAQGNYFKVSIQVTSTNPLAGSLYCAGVYNQPPSPTYFVTQDEILQSVSVAASSSVIYPIRWIQKGAASLSIMPGDTAGKLAYDIVLLDETGSGLGTLYAAGTPTATVVSPVTLTDDALGLRVTNSDTVSHSTALALVPAN